ncbi:hypothetical protein ACFL2A_01750 [Thermodesulfobacteriota bacterium]
MGKPAGVQIKRWLMILALLLFVVNTTSVVSLFLVYNYVDDIKSAYQPIVKSSSIVKEKILSAQVDLYKHLSDYQKDLHSLFTKTAALKVEIKKIYRIVKDDDISEIDLELLTGMLESTERFEKAVKKLVEAEEMKSVDWEKVNTLRNYVMDMGTETQNNAARIGNLINLLITNQNIQVTLVTLIVVCTLFLFFIISIMVMIQLHYWWRHFEDLILEL